MVSRWVADLRKSSSTCLQFKGRLAENLLVAYFWALHRPDTSYTTFLSISFSFRDSIKSTGIAGPVELIRKLVNQAEGRPGLAAALCHLCLKGDVCQIALGDALSRDIRKTFDGLKDIARSARSWSYRIRHGNWRRESYRLPCQGEALLQDWASWLETDIRAYLLRMRRCNFTCSAQTDL